jgi:hypothetical protein
VKLGRAAGEADNPQGFTQFRVEGELKNFREHELPPVITATFTDII